MTMTRQDKAQERKLLTKWKTRRKADLISEQDQITTYLAWVYETGYKGAVHVFMGSAAEANFAGRGIKTEIVSEDDYR